MPFEMPRWRAGRYGSFVGEEPEYEDIERKARESLKRAGIGDEWRDCRGVPHEPMVVDERIVGEMREKVNPEELKVGAYRYGKFGVKVQLVKDGRIAGFLWLS